MMKRTLYTLKTIKKAIDVQQSFFIKEETVLYNNRIITRSSDLLAANGLSLAAAVLKLDGQPMVVVDDDFYALPKGVQDFAFHHEVGHIKLGHLKHGVQMMKQRKKDFKAGRVQKEELEADRYAADQVGTDAAVAALFYLESHFRQLVGTCITTKELRRRAEALINN